jgi:hypothetical protein
LLLKKRSGGVVSLSLVLNNPHPRQRFEPFTLRLLPCHILPLVPFVVIGLLAPVFFRFDPRLLDIFWPILLDVLTPLNLLDNY